VIERERITVLRGRHLGVAHRSPVGSVVIDDLKGELRREMIAAHVSIVIDRCRAVQHLCQGSTPPT